MIQAGTGIGAFLGLGSLAVMACGIIWSQQQSQVRAFRDALVIPVFSLVAGIIMDQVGRWMPPTYDLYLYAFDSSLGISLGAGIAKLFRTTPWLDAASSITYARLLTFPPLYHAWKLHRGANDGINLMHAFAIGGCCGAVLYQLCPAIGPLYCFGKDNFPFHLPSLGTFHAALFPGTGVHNAMPSCT
jgi:hypothetical protein